jgi:2-oxoacid dehydrogenases acyltransferase (catalytic domain)
MAEPTSLLSFSTWRKIAMATWRPRKDPMIWATAEIEASRLLEYIGRVRHATGQHVTPAHLVGRQQFGHLRAGLGIGPVPTFCHVPFSIVTGAVTDKVLVRDRQAVICPVLPLTVGLDHRFIDGYQAATMARAFREYLEDPGAFDPVPISTAARTRTRRSATVRVRSASKPSSSAPVRANVRRPDRKSARR